MPALERCAIDAQVAQIICRPAATLADIRAWQQQRLLLMLEYVQQRSPFYRALYQGRRLPQSLDELALLPLLDGAAVRRHGRQMLCVEQEQIARIYTLPSGGSSGVPKRLYFSAAELEQTVAYYRAGIPMFIAPGDRVLVLLPCRQENSVGRLFGAAVERLNTEPLYHGLPQDEAQLAQAAALLNQQNIDVVLAAPQTMLALSARCSAALRLRSILLSTTAIRAADKSRLTARFACPVFEHYGMAEMCFGGGVDCAALAGYHLREADFITEIVDTAGQPLPPGQWGEIVITTLRRAAMPLIRYATGDYSRFLPQPCVCGSVLPLLDRVGERAVAKRYSMR